MADAYLPGSSVTLLRTTLNAAGGLQDADSLPTGELVRNGVIDGAVTVTVVDVGVGRYTLSFTIPTSYALGDTVELLMTATIDLTSSGAVVWTAALQSAVILGPLAITVSDDLLVPSPVKLAAFHNSERSLVLTVVDSSGNAVDLTAFAALTFTVETSAESPVSQFSITSGFTISGAGNNVLTFTISASNNNITPDEYKWRLWGDAEVIAHGDYSVLPTSA
jgi:hypothetical protein